MKLFALLLAAAATTHAGPPPTEIHPVKEVLHGVGVLPVAGSAIECAAAASGTGAPYW